MQTDWTKVLGWPGYRVYDYQIDEARRHLTLRLRRKRGNRKLICAQCGRRVHDIHAVYERKVRDLPCFEFQTSVVVELYRIRCPNCGVKAEGNSALGCPEKFLTGVQSGDRRAAVVWTGTQTRNARRILRRPVTQPPTQTHGSRLP